MNLQLTSQTLATSVGTGHCILIYCKWWSCCWCCDKVTIYQLVHRIAHQLATALN